ncbi:BTAD domain-containing putative transcriptional regulator [Nocardia sp. NRRL S-836]|uniref:BTAD domain-containing putative transcriptional regulator n=1 Tax=Nocardia sp. NRRL S-836 TaxID=1519492 RepID=UPI0006AE3182|nr:BTAD domain-containing putative transcriptional regulator [Nocardia sp. NRRL S-836]
MEFGLLGEVVAHAGGEPVALGPARRRCVLAALALDAGQVVPSGVLADRIWGDHPPYRAKLTLASYVSRLRAVLPGVVKQRSGGYVLDVERSTVDVHRFGELTARAAGAPGEAAAELLTEALALWRGQALTGIGGAWAEHTRELLERQRLTAATDLADVRLRLGEGAGLVDELAHRAQAHPLDERVAAQYMLALHRAGRSADALEHHRGLRATLAEELGADPGQAVSDLHQRILRDDPALLVAKDVPRQLPAPPATFVGRTGELAALTGRAPVTAVVGPGGMGKTWLVLRWAHEHQREFPDGQLHVDLRGFSPEETPMPSAVAVRGFLDALGVSSEGRPTDPHAQAALLRSTLADKRMLLVLDNAADSEHVTPLLPGGTTCAVLVTSRRHLPGLATAHGARQIVLEPLPDHEARELLTARFPTADPAEVAEVIGLTGGFPLALGIIAGRSHLRLGVIAHELRASGIEALDSDEASASLPAVLSWSHQALTGEESRAFELLAIAPGPDIALPAAAHLLDRAPVAAAKTLDGLARTSLVAKDSHGRYRMHDLVRQYAIERARVLTADERETALDRVLRAYLGLARGYDQVLDPHRTPPGEIPPIPAPAVTHPEALAWFDAEHGCLLASARTAAARGGHDLVWRFAWVLGSYHWRRGKVDDDVLSWQRGVAAAEQLGDRAVLAMAHQMMGTSLAKAHRSEEGLTHLRHALGHAAGDRLRESHVHLALAWRLHILHRDEEALPHARQALPAYRELGRRSNEVHALNTLGAVLLRLGRDEEAVPHLRESLRLSRELGSPISESGSLNLLGEVAQRAGDLRTALEHFEAALAVRRGLDETYSFSHNLMMIGDVKLALGEQDEAVRLWEESLRLTKLHNHEKDTEPLLERLRSVRPGTAP